MTSNQPACRLKGSMYTLLVLQLASTELEAIEAELQPKVAQLPEFFRGAPMAIDLKKLGGELADFAPLVERLRALGFMPVAVQNADDASLAAAQAQGLGLVRGGGPQRPVTGESATAQDSPAPAAAPATDAPAGSADAAEARVEQPAPVAVEAEPAVVSVASRLVTQPVRSGQQVHSPGDLIVVAQVSPGAELLAEGNIHVYGRLRGRALAGLRGDQQARIFCHSLEAELVAIAGCYQIADEMDPAVRNQAVQISLEDEELRYLPL